MADCVGASKSPQSLLADDVIWGVDGPHGIAKFIGVSTRKARWLIEKEQIPIRRFGHRTITASRSELRKLFGAGETP